MARPAERDITLEDFSSAVAAIHAAAAFPERWPEAFSAVARLVNSSGDGRLDGPLERVLGLDPLLGDAAFEEQGRPATKRVMELLAPHLKTAREVRTKLAEALPALAALDRLTVAAFIINAAGAVHHLNASARSLLSHNRWLRLADSRLRFHQSNLNLAFDAALRAATQPPPRSSLLAVWLSGDERYEVTVSPLGADLARLASWSVPRVLVLMTRPWSDDKGIMQRMRRLYGLTEAEARVMAALTMGRTVEEIARDNGVRTSTVRAQVRTIFEKTGVNRQTDLVRLGLTGAPLVSGADS